MDNCTSCRQRQGCAWCPMAQLTASAGPLKLQYDGNAICWSGGFASFTNTKLDENIFSVTFQCSPALATSLVCPIPDVPGVVGICVIGLIPILIIIICVCRRRRRRIRFIRLQWGKNSNRHPQFFIALNSFVSSSRKKYQTKCILYKSYSIYDLGSLLGTSSYCGGIVGANLQINKYTGIGHRKTLFERVHEMWQTSCLQWVCRV